MSIDGKAALSELLEDLEKCSDGEFAMGQWQEETIRAIAAYVEGLHAKVQKTLERHSDSLGLQQSTARRMEMDAKICPPAENEIG